MEETTTTTEVDTTLLGEVVGETTTGTGETKEDLPPVEEQAETFFLS